MKTDLDKKALSPKEELFCSSITAIGTQSFGLREKSALGAGYAEASARNTATALMKRPEIQQRIAELNRENLSRNNITVDKVLQDLEHTRILALEKGDLATSTRCSELQGKYLALWRADRLPEAPRLTALTAEERTDLLEISDQYFAEKYGPRSEEHPKPPKGPGALDYIVPSPSTGDF